MFWKLANGLDIQMLMQWNIREITELDITQSGEIRGKWFSWASQESNLHCCRVFINS